MPDDDVVLMEEIFAEDMENLRAVFESDFAPLLKHQEKLEREAFNAALREVEKLEQEV